MNERNNKQNERRVYAKEFKLDAVELTNKSGKPITDAVLTETNLYIKTEE